MVAENIDNEAVIEQIGKEVLMLCSQFPVPEHFIIPSKNNGRDRRIARAIWGQRT